MHDLIRPSFLWLSWRGDWIVIYPTEVTLREIVHNHFWLFMGIIKWFQNKIMRVPGNIASRWTDWEQYRDAVPSGTPNQRSTRTFLIGLPDGEIMFENQWERHRYWLIPEFIRYPPVQVDFLTLFPHREGLSGMFPLISTPYILQTPKFI